MSRVVPQRGGYGARRSRAVSGFLVHALGSFPLSRRQRGDHGDMPAGQVIGRTHCLPFLFCPLDRSPRQLHRSAPEAQVPHPRAAVQGRVTPSESHPQVRVAPVPGCPRARLAQVRVSSGQGHLQVRVIPGQGHPQARVTQVMAAHLPVARCAWPCPSLPYTLPTQELLTSWVSRGPSS